MEFVVRMCVGRFHHMKLFTLRGAPPAEIATSALFNSARCNGGTKG